MSRQRKVQIYLRTESGNAEMFAAHYGEEVRFDHKQGRWLIWNRKRSRWVEDKQNKVRGMMAAMARRRLRSALRLPEHHEDRQKQIGWALSSESRYRIDASLELAESVPPISDSGEKWDTNPMLLGVANGVVDLRTGRLRDAKPEDRVTLYSPVAFDGDAKCPRFQQFILQVCNGDTELVGFIQRAVGYALTGLTGEQCLFFCDGTGANGKSTLLGVLHYILGDYAVNVPFSALEKAGRSSIPNDLAMLAGRRFATAIETGEDVRLNESRIKAITGGDPVTARYLYHENFTFDSTHKLWLAFNHKPRIADESEGMWRRVRLIPFTKQFSGAERDDKLLDKLKAEAPGVLAWAVRGSLVWQKDGLGEPQIVVNASTEYRAESDHLAQFIEDCCVVSPGGSVPSAELWKGYLRWAEDNEEVPLSRPAFTQRMEQKGFRPGRSGHQGTRTWVGLILYADTLTHADTASQDFPMVEVI
jgi:putative DNA primase/helicase